MSGWVEPFLEFTANRIGIEPTVGAVEHSAALPAVIHRSSNQCDGLFSGHGVHAVGYMVDVRLWFGRGNRDTLRVRAPSLAP